MTSNNFGWIFWKDPSPRAKLADDSKLAGTTKLETLVRELVQNAVDARTANPARLVVEDGTVSLSDLHDALKLDELKAHIKGTLDFSSAENPNNRIVPKCESQLALLDSSRCRYLKFSDFNTKGLEGISKFDKTKAIWKLLFDDGTSAKEASSAGGVGVGKNATFPFSQISTVIYATKTDEGYGLVGSARLNSSRVDKTTYQPEGNFLVYDDYESVISGDCSSIRALGTEETRDFKVDLFSRDEKGSDVIILGTDGNTALSDPYWAKRFALYAIINFYPAILNGVFTLDIKQEGKETIALNASSISDVVESFESDEGDSRELYELIHDAKLLIDTLKQNDDEAIYRIVKQTDPVLGDLTLYMNASPDVDVKCWQLFRSFGMKTITRDVRIQKPVFSIVVIHSKIGSDYLLAAESGNHTEYNLQPLGESKAKEVGKAIKNFESWVAQEVGHFGQVDSSKTDIELAGLTSFIALPGDLKTADAEEGVKPMLELEPAPQEKKIKKRKPRKRDSSKPDPEGLLAGQRKEQWNHNEDSHKTWNGERETKTENVPVVPGDGKTGYDRVVQVKGTFRDIHSPYSKKVELVGKIDSSVYKSKCIDISVLAVNEQGNINDYLPKVNDAVDLVTGEVLTEIENDHVIKGVRVGSDLYVHLEINFAAPFRSSLIESASVVQHIEQTKPQQEGVEDESTK